MPPSHLRSHPTNSSSSSDYPAHFPTDQSHHLQRHSWAHGLTSNHHPPPHLASSPDWDYNHQPHRHYHLHHHPPVTIHYHTNHLYHSHLVKLTTVALHSQPWMLLVLPRFGLGKSALTFHPHLLSHRHSHGSHPFGVFSFVPPRPIFHSQSVWTAGSHSTDHHPSSYLQR